MSKLILGIAEIVIKMLKKRNLEVSGKLHDETHAQYQLTKKIAETREKTAELEDKLALAEIVLGGLEQHAGGKIGKAAGVLEEKTSRIREVLGDWNRK